jgi:hypothetical protein
LVPRLVGTARARAPPRQSGDDILHAPKLGDTRRHRSVLHGLQLCEGPEVTG